MMMTMWLKCGKCGYEWDYRGKQIFYAQCPRCMSRVKIPSQGGKKRGSRGGSSSSSSGDVGGGGE